MAELLERCATAARLFVEETLPLAGAADDDFVLAVFRSRRAHEGFIEEDGEIWSRDGVLLAQSRQLALVL